MKCRYVAIEREYGSGGTKIANMLAEACGISCYGHEILEEVAREHHVTVEELERHEEKSTGSFLYTVFLMSRTQSADSDLVTEEGHLFLEEQKQIRRMAVGGPAVFLGHCAAEALKDQEGLVRVFIRCDGEEKKKRIQEDYQLPPEKMESIRKFFDRKRAAYYKANTSGDWRDPENYDIVLDSSRLGIEGCVAVLKGLFDK